MSRKPRSDAKLKNLPKDIQEELWALCYPSDPETKAYGLEELAGHLLEVHEISAALSIISEWHAWYSLKRRMDSATERAEQARLELAQNPDLKPEDIQRASQAVFSAEALSAGDWKAYIAIENVQLKREAQAIERDKMTFASRSKIEAGLDALMSEIKASPAALKLFQEMKEELKKS